MTSGKIITGLAIGAAIALLAMPKTRKRIYDAFCDVTDSLKDTVTNVKDEAMDFAQKSKSEVGKFVDKTKDAAGSVRNSAAREAM